MKTSSRQFLWPLKARVLDYSKNDAHFQMPAMMAGLENGWIVVPPGYEGFVKESFGAKVVESSDPRIDAKGAIYCREISNEVSMVSVLLDRFLKRHRYFAFFWDPPGISRRDDRRPIMRLRCKVMDFLMELDMRFSEGTVMILHPGFLEGRLSPDAQRKIKVFPNGTMVEANQQAAKDVVRRPKRISISAAFRKDKGCWELVELIKDLWKRDDETEFVWIGTGVDYDEVCRRLREAGCEGPRLIFPGVVSLRESLRLQATSQVSVCLYRDIPSLRWNYVLKAPEALSLGLPFFSWRLPGIREYVKDGETGFCVDVGNVSELADKIYAVLSDDARLQHMRAECLRVAKDYAWDRVNADIRAFLLKE